MLHQGTPISAVPVRVERQRNGAMGRLLARARRYGGGFRLFIVIAAIGFWLGGFTFYAGVAIPMGVEVLGTHKAVGFITQRVTNWLNVGGVAALSILMWNVLSVWKGQGKLLRYTLLATWLAMAAIEVELIGLHPVMDRLLTTQPVRDILDQDRFDLLHHVYLISTTVQWAAGVVHVWCVAVAWHASGAGPDEAACRAA